MGVLLSRGLQWDCVSPVEALSEYAGRGSRATRGQHGAKQGPKVEMAPGRFFVSLLQGECGSLALLLIAVC